MAYLGRRVVASGQSGIIGGWAYYLEVSIFNGDLIGWRVLTPIFVGHVGHIND